MGMDGTLEVMGSDRHLVCIAVQVHQSMMAMNRVKCDLIYRECDVVSLVWVNILAVVLINILFPL